MSVAIVQSKLGGNVSGSSTPETTSAVGYTSNTTSGSLLVCVVWAYRIGTAFTLLPTIAAPVTSGITWTLAIDNATYADSSALKGGRCAMYYVANAPSVSSGTTTTVTVSSSGDPGDISTLAAQFSLYEFSGVKTTSPIDASANTSNGASGFPTTTSLSTSATDLIMVSYVGEGSNGSAGSGYTLGVNSSITNGQTQYILNQLPGTIATAFGSSISLWGCCSVAFIVPPATYPPTTFGQILGL